MKSLAQNLTIVMQGAVISNDYIDKDIIANIRRVRRAFPHSKMTVSTWKAESRHEKVLCKIGRYLNCAFLFNDDPGCITKESRGAKVVTNVNRMIRSTYAGISHAETQYVLKIRTDSYFKNDKFISVFESFFLNGQFKRDEDYALFSQPLINCNLFARNARGYLPFLFHPGDILLAGYKSDLIKLFDIEMADEQIFSESRRACFYTMMKYVPEQYVWVKSIEHISNRNVFNGNHEHSAFLVDESEKYFINNFIPFDADELSFCWPKHKALYQNKGKYSVYDFSDWQRLYNKHILKISTPIDGNYLFKKVVLFFMLGYFFIRTNLLRIPLIKRTALILFNKRG